DVGKFK
nr:RecName: Full=60 kDa cell wall protein [Arabidopsis thaliana]